MSKAIPHTTTHCYNAILEMGRLTLPLYLGVEEHERENKREIHIDMKFFYSAPPKGCESDSIKDAHCYNEISQAIAAFCEGKHFKLLENLAVELHKTVRDILQDESIKLWIRVEKPYPLGDERLDFAAFSYSDA